MKYKVLQLDANGRISFTKEELEKLLDEVYEDGRRDGYGWRYYPYITCSDGTSRNTITTNPNKSIDKWTVTVGDTPDSIGGTVTARG